MNKVFFISNHKGFSKFNAPYMTWFKTMGWQVDDAAPGVEIACFDKHYDVSIDRNPISLKNIQAYKELKKIITENNYDIIHVHTPMGAVLGRLAALKARKNGTKVIYTAHGFHFFKGAPLKNWIMFYPIERMLARYTDVLVTINEEDFRFANRKKLCGGKIYKINGVGVNLDRFKPFSDSQRINKRNQLGIGAEDFVALYTAQLIPRKNHQFILTLLPEIVKAIPVFKLVLAGSGEMQERSKKLVSELGMDEHVLFLGGRSDIPELCGMADIHLSSSLQEGLAIGNIEAMACGCPLVISDIRGHRDVCKEGENGFLFNLKDKDKFVDSIIRLYRDKKLFDKIKENNITHSKDFSLEKSLDAMAAIYKTLM